MFLLRDRFELFFRHKDFDALRAITKKLQDFARWMTIDPRDTELAQAQCRELNSQIPLLYLLLMVNAIAVAYTHRDVAPGYVTIGVLIPMLILTTFRLLSWVRSRGIELGPQQAVRKLRQTVVLGSMVSIVYITWSLSLESYGTAIEQGHVALFIAITVIGCIFCLMHLPQAAIMVMLIVTAPYLVYYLSKGQDVYTAIAMNIFLVCLVILKVLLNGYEAFSNLIKSRSELAAKHQETERLNAENERLSQTDFLTNLPNRRYFFNRLDRQIESVAGTDAVFAVGVIDLDQFKPVNDTYGHQVGDQLLMAVGDRMEALGVQDLEISRLGGDEFGLLYLGPPETAADVAKALCESLQQPFKIGEISVAIGASCGIAFYPDAGTTTHMLFDRSDYALYNSKTTARGSVTVYSADHEARIRSERAIESALQCADIAAEFEVRFQPFVALSKQTIIGFEALARWNSPELGRIPPDVFIQVAERTGQIQRLTIQLFCMAIRQIEALPETLRMSFNLSAHDITSHETVSKLLDIIAERKVDPTRITFEITETSVIGSYEAAEACLTRLRDAGCRLALDDFGTGYSSLGYLHRLPIDCVKIDRSFVACLDDPMTGGVVASILNLCRSMQITCVAEGVEDAGQAEALQQLQCRFAQGYHFCPPKPFADIKQSIDETGMIAGLPIISAEHNDLLRSSAN